MDIKGDKSHVGVANRVFQGLAGYKLTEPGGRASAQVEKRGGKSASGGEEGETCEPAAPTGPIVLVRMTNDVIAGYHAAGGTRVLAYPFYQLRGVLIGPALCEQFGVDLLRSCALEHLAGGEVCGFGAGGEVVDNVLQGRIRILGVVHSARISESPRR